MPGDLKKIETAANGLLFMSESDHPFQLVYLKEPVLSLESHLVQLSGKNQGSSLEKQDLDYFFRNATKVYPDASPEQQQMALRFEELKKVLHQELTDIAVYRIGETVVDAFILGKLPDGTFAGLRTKLIET